MCEGGGSRRLCRSQWGRGRRAAGRSGCRNTWGLYALGRSTRCDRHRRAWQYRHQSSGPRLCFRERPAGMPLTPCRTLYDFGRDELIQCKPRHGELSMTTTRRAVLAGGSLLTSASLFHNIPIAAAQPIEAGPAPEAAAGPLETAIEAYIFGYPLVTMEMTRRVLTNAVKPMGLHAPMGQFANAREYPTAAFKDVTAPNADTLYSIAWLDLSQGPWVLHVPDEHGRYYLMPMLDGWTDVFADPGTRTTGTGAGEFAIAGAGWHGELPPGVEELRSPTNLVWVLGRTYCTGTPEDYTAVHAIQDQYKIVPLSAYGKPYTPPRGNVDSAIDMKTPVRDQVERMDHEQLLHPSRRADEAKPALSGGCTDPRPVGAHRPRPGAGFRPLEARLRCQCR